MFLDNRPFIHSAARMVILASGTFTGTGYINDVRILCIYNHDSEKQDFAGVSGGKENPLFPWSVRHEHLHSFFCRKDMSR
ncbi:MAG: hypothetical protein K5752_02370 [Succinivibrionaceae bacterium]|nr:hypothetical protein [Succinivibrionaceae bacterium]